MSLLVFSYLLHEERRLVEFKSRTPEANDIANVRVLFCPFKQLTVIETDMLHRD